MENQVSRTGVLHPLTQFLLLSIALGDETLNCKTRGVFLSLNRTLAPLDMVTSSDDASGYPATNIYNFAHADSDDYFRTWCTTDFDPDPFIKMELTSPVLITQILFSGRFNPFGSFHVTNLTLEYSPPDNATILSYYTTEAGSIKYFAAPHLNTLIPLEQPLLTKRIRLRPVEWFDYDSLSFEYICLGVGLYGCLATEVAGVDSLSNNIISNDTQSAGTIANSNSVTELIALGIGSAILGALIAIAVVGIVCCCQQTNKRKLVMSSRPVIQNVTASTNSTNNAAYGILEKQDNIELKANECYKSIPPSELVSAPPHKGVEYSLYTSVPPNRAGYY